MSNIADRTNLRKYGEPPFTVAVVHGGPGAPGQMAPVARELSSDYGILEPLQTATSLEGQVQELYEVVEANAKLPVVLIGSSWGAMLSFIVAARHPECVRKLILVGSALFDDQYAPLIMQTRLSRLSEDDRREALAIVQELKDASSESKDQLLARFGDLLTIADHCDPLTLDTEVIEVQQDINQSVWADAEVLRASGQLLELGRRIKCPVVAIHGDYDPHPVEGIREPLAGVLKEFRFVLLEECGHLPWIERRAKRRFYDILREELS